MPRSQDGQVHTKVKFVFFPSVFLTQYKLVLTQTKWFERKRLVLFVINLIRHILVAKNVVYLGADKKEESLYAGFLYKYWWYTSWWWFPPPKEIKKDLYLRKKRKKLMFYSFYVFFPLFIPIWFMVILFGQIHTPSTSSFAAKTFSKMSCSPKLLHLCHPTTEN